MDLKAIARPADTLSSFRNAGRKHRNALLAAILTLAFLLRVAARALSGAHCFWTSGYSFYFTLGRSIATGHGYALPGGMPTAFRVPLYPIFIAAITHGRHDFWALLIAQALVSTGTVACAGALARRLFGEREAVLAAILTAIYPYYVWHDTALQETGLLTFTTALATLLLITTQQRRSIGLAAMTGVALAAAVLTRSTIIPFALVGTGWLLLSCTSQGIGRSLVLAAACLLAFGAAVSPWLVRNHALTGRWTFGTEFGASLYYGNNPATFSFYPERSIDLSAAASRKLFGAAENGQLAALHGSEVARSDWFERRGIAYIAADPARFAIAALRKNVAAFGVVPSPRHDWTIDTVEGGSYGAVLVLGITGWWRTRRRWRQLLPFYAHIALFVAITGLLWGHSSHRAFLDIYLIVFAASALVDWAGADTLRWPGAMPTNGD